MKYTVEKKRLKASCRATESISAGGSLKIAWHLLKTLNINLLLDTVLPLISMPLKLCLFN